MNNFFPKNTQPQGQILEEAHIGAFTKFCLNLPSLFTKYSTFFSIIGSLSFLALIFNVSNNVLTHSIDLQSLIAADLPNSTGAILGERTDAEIQTAMLNDELLSKLPLTTNSFILVFDYGKNVFVVEPNNNNANYISDFIDWLNNSKYSALPADYFNFAAK